MENDIDPVDFIVGKTGGENRAVRNLLDLFAEGATIPFIARYRKEKTGNMDEVRIGEIKTLYTQFQELEKRKNAVLSDILAACCILCVTITIVYCSFNS